MRKIEGAAISNEARPRYAAARPADRLKNAFRLLICAAALLSGCGEPEQGGESRRSDVIAADHEERSTWLGATDRTDPAVWLASQGRDRQLDPNDPEALEMRRLLAVAGRRFLESDRMLANRTAQLAEMLSLDGRPESHAALLSSFSAIVEGTQAKVTYGDLCQFYLNLRRAGMQRGEALQSLAGHYRLLRHDK